MSFAREHAQDPAVRCDHDLPRALRLHEQPRELERERRIRDPDERVPRANRRMRHRYELASDARGPRVLVRKRRDDRALQTDGRSLEDLRARGSRGFVRIVGTAREREPKRDPPFRERTITLGLFVPTPRELSNLVRAERRGECLVAIRRAARTDLL